jgi:CheY-like chemotaxis protein
VSKILVIEDDALNRDLASRILTRRGHEVVLAENGETGILMAASEDPDIILLDLAMPDMDGFETARRIKAASPTGDIPIIALTAFAAREVTKDRALEAGCDDFDTKPIDSQRLLAKIDALLAAS